MPTRGTDSGVGSAAKRVADHAKALVGLELELAQLELKRKVGALGAGAALAAGAAVLGLFAVGFLLATVAAALATVLDTWLALLIVGVALLLLAAIVGGLALRAFKKGTPPVPEKAIEEARRTGEALRSNGGS
jgi:uncharacterized membrane protein YqjE